MLARNSMWVAVGHVLWLLWNVLPKINVRELIELRTALARIKSNLASPRDINRFRYCMRTRWLSNLARFRVSFYSGKHGYLLSTPSLLGGSDEGCRDCRYE